MRPARNAFRELDVLAARVERLEAQLGLALVQQTPEPQQPATVRPTSVAPPATSQGQGGVAVVPVPPESNIYPPRIQQIRAPIARAAPTRVAGEFEKLVGGRWYAVVGAIVIMIGVALFFRLAYTQGWIGMLPAGVKVLSGAFFGLALLAVGEWLRRKPESTGMLAAAAASAAGVGVLYASAYSMYRVYGLVSAPVGFLALAVVSAAGIAVAVRARLVTVAILSLVGGYLAPVLSGATEPSVIAFPAYLFALLVTGLAISLLMSKRDAKFAIVRSCVWWGTVVLGTVWAASMRREMPIAVLGWMVLVWVAFHAELVLWARARSETETRVNNAFEPATWAAARPFATSFSTTAWCMIMSVASLIWARGTYLWSHDYGWIAAALWTALTFAAGFIASGHLRVMRDTPRTSVERLGASLLMQSGAAIIVMIVLATDGWLQPLGGVVLAVAAACTARWLRLRSLHIYATAVLLLTCLDIAMQRLSGPVAPVFGRGPVELSAFSILMCATSATWIALAVSGREPESAQSRRLQILQWTLAAITCVVGAFFMPAWPSIAAILLVSCTCAYFGSSMRSRAPLAASIAMLIAALVRVIVSDYSRMTGPDAPSVHLLGLAITGWTLLPVLLSLACAAVNRFAANAAHGSDPRDVHFQGISDAAGAMAVCVLPLAIANPGVTAGAASIAVAVVAIAAATFADRTRQIGVQIGASLLSLAALVLWVATWVASGHDWSDGQVLAMVLHSGLLQAAIVCVALTVAGNSLGRLRSGELAHSIQILHWTAAFLLLLSASSLEVTRIAQSIAREPTAHRAAVSIWWGLLGFAMIGFGFARRLPQFRHIGLFLLGLGVLKALVWDLAGVPQGWRIVSFVGLGLMMLAVSIAYARLGRLLVPASASRANQSSV